ncbi:MAG: hypothetical protein ACK4GU_09375 [Alishewanella aestuarii]
MSNWYFPAFAAHALEEQSRLVIASVKEFGLCVIPGFVDDAFCTMARDTIDALLNDERCKLWQDPLQADTRIMGVEHLASQLNIFTQPLINYVIRQLYNNADLNGFVMAGKITARPGNLGSGQGWHRDSVNEEQFKALLYLSDVDQLHGPFEYFLKTFSRRSMKAVERGYGIGLKQNRLTDDEISKLPANRRLTLCQKKGTLVIANTRAIHRGAPILCGERYALTTYSWTSAIPPHIGKFVNSNAALQGVS